MRVFTLVFSLRFLPKSLAIAFRRREPRDEIRNASRALYGASDAQKRPARSPLGSSDAALERKPMRFSTAVLPPQTGRREAVARFLLRPSI